MRKINYYVFIIPIVLTLIVAISVFFFWRSAIKYGDAIIANDIELLAKILHQIDKDTGIIDFEHQRNYVDFLNVVKFVGSEVGALNLKNAQNWKGPYLQDNPTYQEKYYEVINTKNGYYIVPGYGVTLSNGKIIGKDIIYTEDADIEKLLLKDQPFNYQGKPLAARLHLGAQQRVELPVAPVNLDVG